MFALAMGTLIGTTMDVMAANNYGVDITASADDIQNAIKISHLNLGIV